jgi:hypothetical protein
LNTEKAAIDFRLSDPLAGARARGLASKSQLLQMEGGVLSSTEAAERLRISRQTVERQRGEGKLLALHLGTKGYRYPSWQFGLPGLGINPDKIDAAIA